MRSYLLAAALAIWALSSSAQVVKVRDFDISEPRDRRAPFATAVTPAGDVLSLIARDTGDWELHRIRDWAFRPTASDKLILKDFFSKRDQKDLESLKADVFVTKDGYYAICVGEAHWQKRAPFPVKLIPIKGTAHADDVITVVDLLTFKTVASVRTAELGLLELHVSLKLDNEEQVFVDSASFLDSVPLGRRMRHAFVRLSVPSLTAGPKCTYSDIYDFAIDSAVRFHREVTASSECEASLGGAIDQYFQRESRHFDQTAVCNGNAAKFCHYRGIFTADRKYGVAEQIEDHDFPYGWHNHRSCIIFSSAKRSDIGEIKLNGSVHFLVASYGGRDYLLLLRDGTRLTVYELQG